MTDQNNEIEILFPQGKEIILNEKSFNIKPFTFGQLPKVIKAITKASNTIQTLKLNNGQINPADAMTILSDSGDELIDLLAENLSVEKAFVENLQVDEAILLITAFFEVNMDFFSKKVAPILHQALKK